MMVVLRLLKTDTRYKEGMRYKISFGEHTQYFTEKAFMELGRKIRVVRNMED